MKKQRYIVGCYKGTTYTLSYDQEINLCASDTPLAWSWFLTVSDEHYGPYRTKRDAMYVVSNLKYEEEK